MRGTSCTTGCEPPLRPETISRVRVHHWLNAPGEAEICVEHQRPGEVNEVVLNKLQEMGVSSQGVTESVKQGRHDHIHATYQLLLRKQHQTAPPPSMESFELESARERGEG